MSIARALSKLGVCSRSEAERLVRAGRVMVDGVVIQDLTLRLHPESARLAVDGVKVSQAERVYLMMNKPRGLVTTRSDPQARATVYDCLKGASLPFVGPVGRLDKASEGLLLLTNDTQWAARLLAPSSHVDKTYHVQVRGRADPELIERLAGPLADPNTGEDLGAKRLGLLRVGSRSTFWLEVVLDEGKNRQIRRLLATSDLEVLRLVRVAFGPLVLGSLEKGAWRMLSEAETRSLAASPNTSV